MDGLLVIDKPTGPTSRDVVNAVQRLLPRRTKIGHTGTLDPLASGVLVLCVGVATRLAEYVQDMDKVYRTTVILGSHSETDDAAGPLTPARPHVPPSREQIEAELLGFHGWVEQVPPAYSALKREGQRAYELARAGRAVELEARRVKIDAIRLLNYEYPRVQLEIACGKGTYIRSLARDLGEKLGCGGYVGELRRLALGRFRADEGVVPERLNRLNLREWLQPLERAVEALPRLEVDTRSAERLRRGMSLPANQRAVVSAVFGPAGELIGVVEPTRDGRSFKPAKILNLSES